MKKWSLMAFLAIGAFGFTACESDDDATGDNIVTVSPQTTRTILQSGTWNIDHFMIGEVDQTSNYADVQLDFLSLGVLDVTQGQSSNPGLWSVSNTTEITPGTNLSAPEIDITIAVNDLLNSLDDDWDITSINESEINLRDEEDGVVYVLRLQRAD